MQYRVYRESVAMFSRWILAEEGKKVMAERVSELMVLTIVAVAQYLTKASNKRASVELVILTL